MFRPLATSLMFVLASCAAPSWHDEPGLPGELTRSDDGTLSGSWRRISAGTPFQQLTIDLRIGTFAVTQGCLGTGGTLRRVQGDVWQIGRYDGGIRNGGQCPPWRPDPALAPFDSDRITLIRSGDMLFAGSETGTARFRRLGRS